MLTYLTGFNHLTGPFKTGLSSLHNTILHQDNLTSMKGESGHHKRGSRGWRKHRQSVMLGSEGPKERAHTLTYTHTHTHTLPRSAACTFPPELLQAERCLQQQPLEMQRAGCSHVVIIRSFGFFGK